MLTISNILSLSRAIFALAFLQDNILIRLLAIFLAMTSDILDGYLARLSKTTSQFGAILDPIMDKFFVFFCGGILYFEQALSGVEFLALLSRDISLCIFGLLLVFFGNWKHCECRALWWGKITTLFQFLLLVGLTLGLILPGYVFFLFVLLALFAFLELILRHLQLFKGTSSPQ